jgi:AAA domain
MKSIEDEFRAPDPVWLSMERRKSLGWSFKSESMAELLARPEPSLEWLIKDIWVDKSRGLIAGHPGVGKTWLALDMLLSVSSGQLCLGKYTPNGVGATLLVEEEASLLNLARRVHSMARSRGLKDTELSNFHHVTRQFLKIPKYEKELIAFIKAKNIKLVVFDSLRRFHNAKENSSDEMQPVLESFARMNIGAECSVILIHHLAKGGQDVGSNKSIFERMRGTGDLWAWRDCIIGVEGEEDSTMANCSFQFRDAEATAPITIKRTVDELSGAISLEATSFDESTDFLAKSAEISAFVKAQLGGVTKNQICKAIEGRKKDNLGVIKRMEKLNLLLKSDGLLVVPN